MRVYIASSPGNEELDELVAAAIRAEGHDCFLPQREIDHSRDAGYRQRAHAAAIAGSDLVIVVGPDIAPDIAWRAGYARALEKRVVLLCSEYGARCENAYLADEMARLGAWDDIPALVANLVARAARRPHEAAVPAWSAPTGAQHAHIAHSSS